MRCALVLFSQAALKDFSGLQVSRAPGSTVVPSHSSPADLAEIINSVVAAGLSMWESRMRFPHVRFSHFQFRVTARPLPAQPFGSCRGFIADSAPAPPTTGAAYCRRWPGV